MRINGSVFTITSHQEVVDWFYSPTAWDIRPGKQSAAAIAIAYKYGFSESQIEEDPPVLDFATDKLSNHWNSLRSSSRFVAYSLEENEQQDIDDWWDKYRQEDNLYLQAAKYVHTTGLENFDFDFKEGDDCLMVVITNKNNNKTFTIKDTEDLEMYFAFVRASNSTIEALIQKSKEDELREFMR